MIHESIKQVLGDELCQMVEQALCQNGGKELDLVAGNDGTYVPAEKHQQLKQKYAQAENSLKETAAALTALGGSGETGRLLEDAAALGKYVEGIRTEGAQRLEQAQKQAALKAALTPIAHDPSDIMKLLDMSSVQVSESGEINGGVEGFIAPIREQRPYLFKNQEGERPLIRGVRPAQPEETPKQEAPSGPTTF